ncbi:Parg [Symbiodinium natans]|uniref:Parg protein n=1 Tax=Symbiodinium natans TaxID=878477 RepID=A0A812UU54_9DINO|nr:Parg [Symbiodinium natans]
MFCGCEIRQKEDGSIELNQERYAEGINEIPLSKVRKEQPELEVTEDERKQFRAALGALSWRATQSAPWLAASVSYLQGCHKAAKVGDLIQANKLIRMQRIYSQQTLYFPSEISEPVLLTYHDASYACRRDGSSQGGVFTMLVDKCVLAGKVGKYSPLGWQSRKLPRICRSSTAAEIQTGSHAMDTHEFTKQLLLEWYNQQVIDYKDMDKALRRFQSVVVTDSKNLYDSVHRIETSGLQLEERRLALEVLSIRERIKSAGMHFKWVDSDQQLADNLSKPFSFQTLLTAIHKGELCLQFDSQFVSAKKKRAWKNKTRSKVDSDSDDEMGRGCLHADFANMYLGGGVLVGGCVQEEIRFSICPELCAAMLVCPFMLDHEAIFIVGGEQFSAYSGYGRSLQYAGDFRDPTPKDEDGTVMVAITAMDALDFRGQAVDQSSRHVDFSLDEARLLKKLGSFCDAGKNCDVVDRRAAEAVYVTGATTDIDVALEEVPTIQEIITQQAGDEWDDSGQSTQPAFIARADRSPISRPWSIRRLRCLQQRAHSRLLGPLVTLVAEMLVRCIPSNLVGTWQFTLWKF